jgi:hypothetical protein
LLSHLYYVQTIGKKFRGAWDSGPLYARLSSTPNWSGVVRPEESF